MAKLLVIDDSLSVRKAIERILAPQGHDLRDASTLASALASLRFETPDLVLCDLILPDGDGLEVCLALRGTGIPVICMSAIADPSVHARVKNAGGDILLSKPFTPADILGAVAYRLGLPAVQEVPEALHAQQKKRRAVMASMAAMNAAVGRANDWPGLIFAAVMAPEGEVLDDLRGPAAAQVNPGRIAELLQVANRVVAEVRSGTVHSLVIEAADARLSVDLIDEGEILVVCVERAVLLGMALLYARRLRRLAEEPVPVTLPVLEESTI